jgi:hypothetical protein
MTRNEALALGIGITGLGGYLYFAYQKCWFPFSLTERCKTVPPPGPGAPPAPTSPPNVSISLISEHTAKLDISWDAVPGATYYEILVNGNRVGSFQTTSATIQLTNVSPGDTLQVAIKACN